MCEKPTHLCVGWIAQNNTWYYINVENIFANICRMCYPTNRFWHEPYAIVNGHRGVFGSESFMETH